MPSPTNNHLLVQIHELLARHFNEDEFRELCFRLSVTYDDLEGNSLRAKKIGLVTLTDRENRLHKLRKECVEMRPNVTWPPVPEQGAASDLPHLQAQVEPGQPTNLQPETKRPSLLTTLRQLPTWAWGGGLLGLVTLVLLLRLTSDGFGSSRTPTPTQARSVVVTNITPPPNAQQGDRWTRPSDGMVLVYVPGGTFLMGSDPAQDSEADSDEFPQHEVTLSPYWLDRTEVTNAMYAECVAAGICAASSYADDNDFNGDAYPVVGVSWNDADTYCTWAGGQLPTEAQWEFAARGDDGLFYPWGNQWDGTLANFCDTNCTYEWHDPDVNDGYALTAPVGSYTPGGDSWIGAADMAGNVWEWVDDWYGAYANTSQTDPSGPESGDYRVLRGGSWSYNPHSLRAATRGYYQPTVRFYNFGFRCVLPPGS